MSGRYNFIKLKRVQLRNFTLFKKDGKCVEIDEEINDGIYCLAGANGLGKTTLLNTINYAITGLVLEPQKKISSPDEIVPDNKRFTEGYFEGRIASEDMPTSEVEVDIEVNDITIKIIRGFTNRDELKLFQVLSDGKIIESHIEGELPKKDINILYQRAIERKTGLNNFNYFIFIQLYILTFDENRRLLFWDNRASSIGLSLVFNMTL